MQPGFWLRGCCYIECTNILWKYVRRFGYPPGAARQDVADLVQLPLHVAPTADLAEAALALALVHGLTAYDAAYAALGHRRLYPRAGRASGRRRSGTGERMRALCQSGM